MKRAYIKPATVGFSLSERPSLLAGSNTGSNTQPQATPDPFNGESYSTNDILDNGDASFAM
jgi:hypothetical protein